MTRDAKDEGEELEAKERFLVFLRHGIAEDPSDGKADEDRSLTSEGHARMKQIARGLERTFPKAQAIWASPLLRAVQTALWVSKGYRMRIEVKTSDTLVPDADPRELLDFLETISTRRVVFVAHEPILTRVVMELIGLKAGQRLELKKGGAYGVRLRADGSASLEWLLSPRLLRKLGDE